LIRFIGHHLTVNNEAFYRLIAATIPAEKCSGIAKGHYGFFVSRWIFSGMRVEEELRVRAINLDTEKILSDEESWSLVNIARLDGSDWSAVHSAIDLDSLQDALYICSERLDHDFEIARREKSNENQDRVSFQIESAQRHRDRQLATREQVLERYHASGNTRMIPAAEGLIKKIKERFDVQVEMLRQKSELNSSSDEVCCGAIRII
jgi:hypothetical protein